MIEEHLKDLRGVQKRQLNQLNQKIDLKRIELRKERERTLERYANLDLGFETGIGITNTIY